VSSADNMKTGPCTILLDGTSVGYTEGDVTFSDGLQTRERKHAQAGENIVDLIVTGHQPTVSFRVAEITLANMQAIYPDVTTVTNAMYFGKTPGDKAGDSAVRLVLRPIKSTGSAEDIVLFKAVIQERAEVGFNTENDRIHEVTMMGLYDDTRTDGKRIGFITVPTGT